MDNHEKDLPLEILLTLAYGGGRPRVLDKESLSYTLRPNEEVALCLVPKNVLLRGESYKLDSDLVNVDSKDGVLRSVIYTKDVPKPSSK